MSGARQDGPPQLCPECGEGVGADGLEAHLRRRHHVYQFRGQRRSFNDTIAALLQALCAPPGDAEAWRLLESVAREQYGPRADHFLSASLTAALSRVEADRRGPALDAAALAILAGQDG